MKKIIAKKNVDLLRRASVQRELGLPPLKSNMSPFRYPGGKGKLSKFLAAFLIENDLHGTVFVEPFCGGAGGSLPLLEAGLISHLVLNDYNKAVAKFWELIKASPDTLINKIEKEKVDIERWKYWRAIYEDDAHPIDINKAFSAFFLNRTNRSGVLHAGPIGGKDQSGNYKIDCRFTKKSLIARIEKIALLADKITVKSQDAAQIITESPQSAFIYADPPYVKEGKGIYRQFAFEEEQHRQLSCVLKDEARYWLLSYDDDKLVHDLYSCSDINVVELSYVMNTAKLGRELLIASSWLTMPTLDQLKCSKSVVHDVKPLDHVV
ncbi:DNA adenine methylase [Pseudoalteromonas ruthenica]|uniref:DNA adenine methylase n=1 Tax=Pseudoalteromonas ruthenica TaxID=151081 RepID=UPI00241E5E0C|nr:DNA adenine methylase [Pseudoalteromonas ruthenica]|tara:strand:- start:51139 stop:52104 length:966 start_codon:yes stop_codon:yes gene_type:complete